LTAGADPLAANAEGKTAAQQAEAGGDPETAAELKRAAAAANADVQATAGDYHGEDYAPSDDEDDGKS